MAHILLLEANPALRTLERTLLRQAEHTVLDATTVDAALALLRAAEGGLVVLCGNADPDYRHLVVPFFSRVASLERIEQLDHVAAAGDLASRHRYICLTTVPEHVPPELAAIFRHLGVRVLKKPFYPDELLVVVAGAAAQLAT